MKPDLMSRILGTKVEVDVTKTEAFIALQTEFNEFKTEANSVVALQKSEIDALKVERDALQTRVEELSAYAKAEEEAKAKALADAEAKRLSDRKEKIVAAVGTDKSESLMEATKDLDDTSFAAVMSALSLKVETETKSPLFNELGVSGDVDASKVVFESKEMQMIREKYPQRH